MYMMKKSIIGLEAFFIGGLLLIYYLYNPEIYQFPKCPFFVLTKLKCPGCGSQRAIHALLHFDILSASKYNALMVLSLPAIILLLYAESYREKRRKLYIRLHQEKNTLAILVIIIVWWIVRNILNL